MILATTLNMLAQAGDKIADHANSSGYSAPDTAPSIFFPFMMLSVFLPVIFMVLLPVVIITIVGQWKAFEKAGRPGWASLIPIYNVYTALQVAQMPGWVLLLYFFPGINLVLDILLGLRISARFGKGPIFGIVLAFYPQLIWPIIGLGNLNYTPFPGSSIFDISFDPPANPYQQGYAQQSPYQQTNWQTQSPPPVPPVPANPPEPAVDRHAAYRRPTPPDKN